MIRILSIVWYKILPARYGGQKGIALFNKHLSTHFPLVCLCSHNNKPANDLSYKLLPQLPVNKFQFVNPFCWIKIIRTVKKEKVSHIILEHPYHGIAGFFAKNFAGIKLIVHSHNIESLRFKEQGKWWWRILSWYEKWTHGKADLTLFKTNEDLQYALLNFKLQKNKCMVLPYGIEQTKTPEHFTADKLIRDRHGISNDEMIILFAGTLDYTPNKKAVVDLSQKVIPLLTEKKLPFKIIVCGRNQLNDFPDNINHPLLSMTGEVDDIENYFVAADLFVNPVQSGGGIQTKTIDALGYHLNVVCFKNMLAGINEHLCNGKIFSAERGNWNEFADLVIKALAINESKTPDDFFRYYSFATQTEKFAARLKSL